MSMQRSDSDIKQDVLDELKWSPEVKETDIGVFVKDSAVTLKGTVPFYFQKSAALRCAKRIRGVRALADDIEVKLPSANTGTDKDIAEQISRSFASHPQIPEEDIRAEVDKGGVTLTGNVDWAYQRDSALRLVEGIKGVRVVLNNINIRRQATVPGVKNEIIRALHRHATIESSRVNILVVEGVVTLSGDVDSFFEKQLIHNTAASAPGVYKVVDNLNVAPKFSAAA